MLHYARQMIGHATIGGALDTQTVTVGGSGRADVENRRRGFVSGSIGSIADGTSNIYAGAAIDQCYWDENGGSGNDQIVLEIAGTLANSGWTTMSIGGVPFDRASANYGISGGETTWTWPNLNLAIGGQPFGATGGTKTVAFT